MKRIVTLALVLAVLKGVAQQDPMISQNLFAPLLLNPAYAGSHEYANATALHRDQWVKIEGAPVTSLLSADAPLYNKKMGLGITAVSDRIGVTRQTDVFGSYAYHLKIQPGRVLALGLRAGVSWYSAETGNLQVWDQDDPIFGERVAYSVPKGGFGIYYYQHNWFVGAAVPSLLQVNRRSLPQQQGKDYRHYYLNTAYVFKVSDNVALKPFVQVKYHPSAPAEADILMHALFKNTLWIGAGYRTMDGLVCLTEVQVTPQFRLGYAFDRPTSRLSGFTAGSHEFFIAYDLRKEKIKSKSPRYF
jgi:type IX secretion system PorP/SprF family membrane protein